MSLNEIIDRFTLVSGLNMEDASRYLPLIIDCKELFEEKLSGEYTAAQLRRIVHACAVYAYYRVCLFCRRDDIESLKAGDLQLETYDREKLISSAELMWSAEKAAIADIIDMGDDFAFRSVDV